MPSHRVLIELTRRYCEPHRHYHTIEHIASMLRHGRGLGLSEEQWLAIWFHDAVYEVPGPDNEERSAELAVQLLSAEGYPADKILLVERMVLDTKAHQPTTEESALVIDLDLAPLGVPWEQFAENWRNLELEYEPLPREQIERGRKTFLEGLLARQQIYSTEWGAQWETQARNNARQSLELAARQG